ncbi:transporter, small conductance mechanosensitive ion channel MscS family protein [Anaerococcus lactolyticus ATCC 51172]|uniref:Transporter, small conductance mechanosensitive ion channel MscS family protein n=1 Tax=Anaerococcus lactolyticus ATCC 51172 TaxID=525254 RepID=C2BI09_9FIRM|nr:mechanosensitive ion channel family protein [Anaerococcus lactolyticus]EEI85463.1 transporter, small conductance mechanosensitive ion channel MscS family protein [Anaerococcus lactolyticus ATCC 51172]
MENLENQVLKDLNKNQMMRGIIKNVLISRLITIGLAILIGFILIRLAKKGLNKVLNKNQTSKVGNTAKVETISKLLYSIIKYSIIFIVTNIILDSVGINTSSLIATAGIGGIAIAFGSQTIIQDFIMGIFIVIDDRIRVGDWVIAAGCEGTVEKLSLRTTLIRDFNGSVHIIPNSQIKNVQNFNRGYNLAQVTFSLPYDVSLKEAKEIISTVASKLGHDHDFKGKIIEGFKFFEITSFEPVVYLVKMTATTKEGYQWAYQRAARSLVKEEMEKRNIRTNKVELKNEKIQAK